MKVNIANITAKVFPEIKIKPALDLFNQFKKKKYPDLHYKIVYEMIMQDAEEYSDWLNDIYLKNSGLDEKDFDHFIRQIRKLSFEQSKIAMAELKRHFDNWDRYPENKDGGKVGK